MTNAIVLFDKKLPLSIKKIYVQMFLYMSVFISLTSFKVKSDMSEYCTQNKLDVWDYKCNLSCIHICTFMVKNSSASCLLTKRNLLSITFKAYCNWIIIPQGKFFILDKY